MSPMPTPASIWLMYHDVYEPPRSGDVPQSAAIYHVSASCFRAHIYAIAQSGKHVTTVGEFLRGGCHEDSNVVLTFDDGWAGAFEVAVPLLVERGWKATFFVTRDFVGRNGFCQPSMLIEAANAGMEIAVHGTTHRMLSSCSPAEIVDEFRACKNYLESLLGRPVLHASLPGGDVTPTVIACAKQAGIGSLCNSRPGLNGSKTSHYDLTRVAVRARTSAADVARYCSFALARERARWILFHLPRTVLGMQRYSHLRRWILREPNGNPLEVFRP